MRPPVPLICNIRPLTNMESVMRKWITGIAVIVSLFVSTTAYAAEAPESCNSFANIMIKRVISVFHDTTASEDQKRGQLALLFRQAVDTDWIGKFVLGQYWRTASPRERQEFLAKYRSYLTNVYISKFNDDEGLNVDDIKITSIVPEQPGQFQVKSLIKIKGDDDIQVDYLLGQSSGKCQVHDIQIEGVSLLATERSDFQAAAASGGVKGVIAAMEQQIAAIQM